MMNRMVKIISALPLAASLVACGENADDIAEYIYINGNIITINDLQPSAEALAIKDGIILAVGDNEQVLASQGSTTEIIDLEGISVVPGFIDAHSHFAGVAAIGQLIRLLEKLNSMIGGRDHRTVMIHGQFTRHDQIESLQDLGVFPALYPLHTFYWGRLAS